MKENYNYFDIGGGMQVKYWKENGLWHMKSDLTDEEYISDIRFSPEIFYSTSKLNEWLAKATKI